MATPNDPAGAPDNMTREEFMSALFANMISQQANMAFMFLGRVPHPETGEVMQDFETARFFIDQLEMLEVKTRGNLDKREDQLLKQSITGLRLAFVEAVEGKGATPSGPGRVETAAAAAPAGHAPAAGPRPAAEPPPAVEPRPAAEAQPVAAETGIAKPSEDESRKKFSKKY